MQCAQGATDSENDPLLCTKHMQLMEFVMHAAMLHPADLESIAIKCSAIRAFSVSHKDLTVSSVGCHLGLAHSSLHMTLLVSII